VARPQQADRLRRHPRRPGGPAHGFRPPPEGARPHVRWTVGRDDVRSAAAHDRRGGGAPADASAVRRAPHVLAARARPVGACGRAGARRRGGDRRPAGAHRPVARARGRARRGTGADAGRGPAAHRAPPGGGAAIAVEWGDVFLPAALAKLGRGTVVASAEHRAVLLHDLLSELTEDALGRSFLAQLLMKYRPDAVVDSINTATAFAYQDVVQAARELLERAAQETADRAAVEQLTLAIELPRLIAHM